VVLRRKLAVLLAMVMLVMMSAAPALALNEGNKGWDGGDKNQGGGQEHPKNEHHQIGKFK
jgi:hypothetical protein